MSRVSAITIASVLLTTSVLSLAVMKKAQQKSATPSKDATAQAVKPPLPRVLEQTVGLVRLNMPIRLGGFFTMGLGEGTDPLENSGAAGTPVSQDNLNWIAANCDVIALNATNITPNVFPALTHKAPLLTPLLHLYGSTLYEQPYHRGNAGGWRPTMAAWTLRDDKGREVRHPDAGGHWMDFGNVEWAAHWRGRALSQVREYRAQGILASEMPLGNPFVADNLAKYKTLGDRGKATETWLKTAHMPGRFLLIPSALGFDTLTGHPTLPTPPGTEEPELVGRLWDELYTNIDGAWAEGWVRPYWADKPLPETVWEIELEAADRAARNGQVFIANAAYQNEDELEYALASYLLVTHRQGRFIFQPMPLSAGKPPDAGYSLAVLRREVQAKDSFFNAPLGAALDERTTLAVEGGLVWRRPFQFGIVYVNSSDTKTLHLYLSGTMQRVNGKQVGEFEMPPHSGAILLFTRTTAR